VEKDKSGEDGTETSATTLVDLATGITQHHSSTGHRFKTETMFLGRKVRPTRSRRKVTLFDAKVTDNSS
jgi:hypothetical protein